MLSDYPHMVEEQRFFHLGLDVIVPLETLLYSPLHSTVKESGYEQGDGNYGGYVLLMHESYHFETFYTLYGYLKNVDLPLAGQRFSAGESFTRIGNFHENGNSFYHTHIQVITQEGLDLGFLSKGYCAASELAKINRLPLRRYLF